MQKLFWAKTGVILGTVPLLIWAHDYGPDPGKSNVPGESNCTEIQCHVGTALNGGPGKVTVTFPKGLTYIPGVKQHLQVTIADPAEHKAGFQLTARAAGDTKSQAGSFASTDAFTLVLCADPNNLQNFVELDAPNPQTCPSSMSLAYMEHNLTGASRLISTGTETYEFDWLPPATNVGNVTLYVAGNGANGDGTERGDHIYAATYTLTPGSSCPSSGSPPVISAGQVQNGASFLPGIVPNAWLQIKGTNLSAITDTWSNSVGPNGELPTSLDCVSVTVGGQAAYIYVVSPGQINVLAPNVGLGPMPVVVTTPDGTSNAEIATSQQYGPAFFEWPANQAVATHTDYSLAVKNGTFPTLTTVAAKPGEVILLWGSAFGPTSPAPPVGVATPPNAYFTASPIGVTLAGRPLTVYNGSKAALVAGDAGLFLLAIQVPADTTDGDYPIIATIQGASSPASIVLSVKQ